MFPNRTGVQHVVETLPNVGDSISARVSAAASASMSDLYILGARILTVAILLIALWDIFR